MTRVIFATLLAAFATVAQAVKLTNSNWDVVAGETFVIGWTDAEGQVSIRLKSGPANSLQTVEEIASGQSGESFAWTVPANLDAAQYAIEIEDGSGNINYSVQFSVSGESASQTTGSAEEPATTTAAAAIRSTSALADVSPAPTSATNEAPETLSTTETPMSSADPTQHTLTTTRANRPSTTTIESDAAETDTTESEIPNSGAAGHSRGALFGAVVGVLVLAYY